MTAMRFVLPCLCVLATSFVSGCLTVRTLPPAERARLKSVAVIANFDAQLTYELVGTTAFTNAEYQRADPSGGINAALEAMAASALAADGLTVPDISRARPAFTGIKPDVNFWTGKDATPVLPALSAARAQAPADGVLLLSTGGLQDPFMGTNQYFSGYGLYHRAFFGTKSSIAYIVLTGSLYDPNDGRLIMRRTATGSAPLPEWEWKKEDEPSTAEELQLLQAGVSEAARIAIGELMREFGFVR